jgi:hypothetical protein
LSVLQYKYLTNLLHHDNLAVSVCCGFQLKSRRTLSVSR